MSPPYHIDRRNITGLMLAALVATLAQAPFDRAPYASMARRTLAPQATPVLMVPYRSGLIVAADGRQTLFGRILL